MNIGAVIEYLNKEHHYNLSADYYARISVWRNWWEGFYKPFHEYSEQCGDKLTPRKLYSLRMGKKVCEDWASLLMNDKTQISAADAKSAAYLQGKNESGGLFDDIDFGCRKMRLSSALFRSARRPLCCGLTICW